jgi:galactokinase
VRARQRATEAFERRFGRAPACVVETPGRVELLGNHTDYNEGLVLGAAIDRSLAVAAAPRPDALLRFRSLEEDDEAVVDPAAWDPAAVAAWVRYPTGVVAALRARGARVPGFDAVVASDVPVGAGLGSSAALEVATALAIRALDGSARKFDDAERWALAHLCRAAERDWAGVPCGLLDQATVLFGRAERAVLLDCRVPSIAHVPLGDAVLVVCDSGERHALVQGRYAGIAAACAAATRALGVAALRDASPEDVARCAAAMDARAAACARHVVDEIARVARAAEALRANDLGAFGRLMTDSHASSRTLLGNSTPGLDALVDAALAVPGCLGARLTGGGFGGAIVALADAGSGEALCAALPASVRARTGRAVAAWALRPAAGAAR